VLARRGDGDGVGVLGQGARGSGPSSAASMSSIRGSVEVSSSGSSVVVAVVHSAIPIGTVVLRSAYSGRAANRWWVIPDCSSEDCPGQDHDFDKVTRSYPDLIRSDKVDKKTADVGSARRWTRETTPTRPTLVLAHRF